MNLITVNANLKEISNQPRDDNENSLEFFKDIKRTATVFEKPIAVRR